MRVDDWSLDRIMQLPDWCFGRRWQISLYALSTAGAPVWDITEMGLPERCVLWEWTAWSTYIWLQGDRWRLALGDQLPTTVAMMNVLSPLLYGLGVQEAEPRGIIGTYYTSLAVRGLRLPIESAGRRLILEVDAVAEGVKDFQFAAVISSMPKEIPDWLISGPDKRRDKS